MGDLETLMSKKKLKTCILSAANPSRGGDKSLILEFDRRHLAYDEESQYKTSDTKIKSIGQN